MLPLVPGGYFSEVCRIVTGQGVNNVYSLWMIFSTSFSQVLEEDSSPFLTQCLHTGKVFWFLDLLDGHMPMSEMLFGYFADGKSQFNSLIHLVIKVVMTGDCQYSLVGRYPFMGVCDSLRMRTVQPKLWWNCWIS